MYTAKHAMLIREKYPDTEVHVFYIDVRTPGKNYDEFYRRAVEMYGVDYIKGMVGKVYGENGKLMVQGENLIDGEQVTIASDLVVLATAIEPEPSVRKVATLLTASIDTNNFLTESHAKLRPVESPTAGVYLAGVCQGPKDIPETGFASFGLRGESDRFACEERAENQPVRGGRKRKYVQRLRSMRQRVRVRRDHV